MATDPNTRFITLWRKTGEKCLEWDSYVSDSRDELEQVIANLLKQGVHQYHTYPLGDLIPALSSEY